MQEIKEKQPAVDVACGIGQHPQNGSVVGGGEKWEQIEQELGAVQNQQGQKKLLTQLSYKQEVLAYNFQILSREEKHL